MDLICAKQMLTRSIHDDQNPSALGERTEYICCSCACPWRRWILWCQGETPMTRSNLRLQTSSLRQGPQAKARQEGAPLGGSKVYCNQKLVLLGMLWHPLGNGNFQQVDLHRFCQKTFINAESSFSILRHSTLRLPRLNERRMALAPQGVSASSTGNQICS